MKEVNKKPGRKPSEARLKRLIAIEKIKDKYGSNITNEEINAYLLSDFNMAVTRQTVWKDLEYAKTHDITEYTMDSKKLLLEVDRDELTTQLENTRRMQAQAKTDGDTRAYLTATKLMKDIITSRSNIDKSIDELKMSEQASDRPIINLTIGAPKAIDKDYYKQRQEEIKSKSKFAGRK